MGKLKFSFSASCLVREVVFFCVSISTSSSILIANFLYGRKIIGTKKFLAIVISAQFLIALLVIRSVYGRFISTNKSQSEILGQVDLLLKKTQDGNHFLQEIDNLVGESCDNFIEKNSKLVRIDLPKHKEESLVQESNGSYKEQKKLSHGKFVFIVCAGIFALAVTSAVIGVIAPLLLKWEKIGDFTYLGMVIASYFLFTVITTIFTYDRIANRKIKRHVSEKIGVIENGVSEKARFKESVELALAMIRYLDEIERSSKDVKIRSVLETCSDTCDEGLKFKREEYYDSVMITYLVMRYGEDVKKHSNLSNLVKYNKSFKKKEKVEVAVNLICDSLTSAFNIFLNFFYSSSRISTIVFLCATSALEIADLVLVTRSTYDRFRSLAIIQEDNEVLRELLREKGGKLELKEIKKNNVRTVIDVFIAIKIVSVIGGISVPMLYNSAKINTAVYLTLTFFSISFGAFAIFLLNINRAIDTEINNQNLEILQYLNTKKEPELFQEICIGDALCTLRKKLCKENSQPNNKEIYGTLVDGIPKAEAEQIAA